MDEQKESFADIFTWKSIKRRWLLYLYPMSGLLCLLGTGLIFMAVPPWHFKEGLTVLVKLSAALTIFAMGAGHLWVGVWAFRRGPLDLSRGDQILSAFLCFVVTGIMFFIVPSDLAGGLMGIWAGVILYRLPKKDSDAPQAGKES